jgi:hypothetical protein
MLTHIHVFSNHSNDYGHLKTANVRSSADCRKTEQSTVQTWAWFLSWFITRFESRSAHGRGDQWNTSDMRVYTGSGLREDKNTTSCVRQLYYDYLDRDPLNHSFYRLRGRVYKKDPVSYDSI